MIRKSKKQLSIKWPPFTWSCRALEQRLMLAADAGIVANVPAEISTVGDGSDVRSNVSNATASSIVFVDAAVQDAHTILNGISSGHEVVVLNGTQSGIDQISQVLQARSNVKSVHIISHGESGKIQIGSEVVDEQLLLNRQSEIRGWSESLAAGADFLIYGCDTAAGQAGAKFVQQFARLVKSDVAASIDRTGSTLRSADWDLEYTVGKIDTAVVVDNTSREKFCGLLPITINAAGQTGQENLLLQIDGQTVAEFENVGGDINAGQFQVLSHDLDGVEIGRVRLVFNNDLFDESNNIDRNVRIDNIVVDGVTYETESANTFSTGTWKAEDGIVAGFRESEFLHANGYFQFDAVTSDVETEIVVRATGAEGGEQFRLLIDDTSVATFTTTTTEQAFSYTANGKITASQITVEFINDEFNEETGVDRNLIVNNIQLAADVFETEAATVFSTGTWLPEDGIVPGFRQSETLHANGTFQYGVEATDPTLIVVRASGDTGSESMSLLINDVVVQSWDNVGTVAQDYSFTADSPAAVSEIKIAFNNDLFNENIDRNLVVDYVSIDGVIFETEDPSVFSTGTWKSEDGITPGYRQSEILHANGYFVFGRPGLGALALADNFYSVNELDGSVSIEFVRSLSSEGEISVDYNLLSGSAVANEDFTSSSGRVTLADGETSASVSIAILDDGLSEGVEDFTITIENQSPGALLLAPRTATIEIIDDEDPTNGNPGNEDPVLDILLQETSLITGLIGTTAIDFSTDGSIMYVASMEGKIYVYADDELKTDVFLDFTDRVNAPRGLLDIAVHPDFDNNGYIYLAYAYDPPETAEFTGLAGPDGLGNRASRVTRVTADVSNGFLTVVEDSEVVILGKNSTWDNFNGLVDSTVDFEEPPAGILADGTNLQDFLAADSQSHTVDSLRFGPDGYLYVSNGDGTSYNQVDTRTFRVQDIDNLSGKLLRIDAITGEGAADNPFFESDNPNSNRSKVYQYGFRNPFRIAIDDVTGQTYVGDVGWSDWEEINAGAAGDNFGWPYYEGGNGIPVQTPFYEDTPEAQAFYESGAEIAPALLGLNHVSDEIDAITLGDVYYGDDLGEEYEGSLIYSHLGSGIVNAVLFDAQGDVSEVSTIATGYQFLVYMTESPDGRLFFVDFDDGNIGYWTLV